jgi:hypothetical protein
LQSTDTTFYKKPQNPQFTGTVTNRRPWSGHAAKRAITSSSDTMQGSARTPKSSGPASPPPYARPAPRPSAQTPTLRSAAARWRASPARAARFRSGPRLPAPGDSAGPRRSDAGFQSCAVTRNEATAPEKLCKCLLLRCSISHIPPGADVSPARPTARQRLDQTVGRSHDLPHNVLRCAALSAPRAALFTPAPTGPPAVAIGDGPSRGA